MEGKGFTSAGECWKQILADAKKNVCFLKDIERFARENTTPAKIVFGTSGWRGEVGTDFTFNNLRIVTTAIIETLKTGGASLAAHLGVKGFDEVKMLGVIVGHDNRFLGPEFSSSVMGLLLKEGIKVYYAGETTTPELSAAVCMLPAACSINITPSHNPANYAGLKFNPSDGGPAGHEITDIVEKIANRIMAEKAIIHELKPQGFQTINTLQLYKDFIEKQGTLNVEKIRRFVKEKDCFICIDHVHGASRGRPEALIDKSPKIKCLRTEGNFLFGGIAPEPSAKNMKLVMDALKESKSKFKIGVLIDPDGDRVRFTDGELDITMNHFGAMALHFLHHYKKIPGVLVKSVATSNFGNAIAEKLGIPIKEAAVGFKNFRPYMLPTAKEQAIVAYEESDGITGYRSTLEKDAMFGFLLAIEMVAVTGKNLGEYLRELEAEFGTYFPERASIQVERSLAGDSLTKKLSILKARLSVGSKVAIGKKTKIIKNVITVDGMKFILEDNSWFLIRPSGTEPKVRFYVEPRTPDEIDAMVKMCESLVKEALA